MIICDEELCTGCSSCALACPTKAIILKMDRKGFLRPVINEDTCISCGKCQKVCVVNNQNKHLRKGDVFACWNLDKKKRLQSTSGGLFRLIAERILADGGVVYGAAFDSNMVLKHKKVVNEAELLDLIGSKYVQSVVGSVYAQVKKDLIQGNNVLFSGVACQISALRNYLGKEYDNLLCVDILCHGVPSPLVFHDYIKYMEKRFKSKVLRINFRYKKPNWTVFSMKIDFQSGKTYIKSKFKDPFLYFFLVDGGDLMLRPSCHRCQFTSPERVSDITLADFWKYKASTWKKRGSERGINLVIVNTEKGKEMLEVISKQIYIENSDWNSAISSNLSFVRPWNKPEKSDLFWTDYFNLSFDDMVKKYCDKPGYGEFASLRRSWANSIDYLGINKIIQCTKKIARR